MAVNEGDLCHEYVCLGRYEYKVINCRCHMGNPPCSRCTEAELYCNECGCVAEIIDES